MSTITFVTPNSISQKEFIALRENKFELHCLNMKLASLAPEGKVFSGPGMIQQTPEGKLHFIFYAQEKVSTLDFIQQLTGHARVPVGSIIPKDKYYQLSAQDLKGRNWICEQVSPAIDSSSDEGTICTGNLTEIIYTNREAETKKEILYLEIFDNQIKLPYNARTVINKNVAGKESVSMSLNVLQFSVGETEFFVQRETESLLLTATSTNSQFVENFDLRVIEALQLVLARPLRWSIMIKLTNGRISTHIRDTRPDNLKYRIQPPISVVY